VGDRGDGSAAFNNTPWEEEFPDMPCYKYDEAAATFVFWGRNAALRLLSATQMRAPP
jgi:hypothetical protein